MKYGGSYHLFVSAMPAGTNLSNWGQSLVDHAIAPNISGPYVYNQTTLTPGPSTEMPPAAFRPILSPPSIFLPCKRTTPWGGDNCEVMRFKLTRGRQAGVRAV